MGVPILRVPSKTVTPTKIGSRFMNTYCGNILRMQGQTTSPARSSSALRASLF